MAPKVVDPEEQRKRILAATIKVVGTKGFAGTKIELIAKEAGIGKGTIYEYFKNKDEVIAYAVRWQLEEFNEISQIKEVRSLEEFGAIIREYIFSIAEAVELQNFFLQVSAQVLLERQSELLDEFRQMFRHELTHFVDLIKPLYGKPPSDLEDKVRLLLAFIDGLQIHISMMPPGEVDFEGLFDTFWRKIFVDNSGN